MNKTKILASIITTAFLLMAISPVLVSAQDSLPGSTKSGPYVEKLVFDVIIGDDQQVLALQDDEIDLIGDMVDPMFLDTLVESENIDVANVLRNGYGYMVINCDKYPFNITAFRRALAFALDKEAISDDVWGGLSVPQDSVIPQVNPMSIEGQLPYTYYESNVVEGNELLDAAGFIDVDDDGYREAPDGSDFDVLVECAQSSNIAIEVGQLAAAALTELSIDATSVSTDFYEYLNRLYFHGDFDIVFLGTSFNTFDTDFLAYTYGSASATEPYLNYPMFRNATFDSWADQLLHATDYDDVLEACQEMQKIWVYECPEIICYENVLLSAYRTDRFDGFINDVSNGVPGWWTNYKIHLKTSAGGPFGGTFRWSNPLDLDTFNFMASTSAYTANVLNQLYDQLIMLDPDGNDMLWLAESYVVETHADNPTIPDGSTRITFDIIQNATWSDGVPLTAEDIAFTLNFYRDSPGNQFGADLTSLSAAYAPTPYSCIVEFDTESYWHVHVAGYKPIIPKHVFEEIGTQNWNTWNPHPPTETMVTSGPFNVSEYVAGEFCELVYNPNYFFGIEHKTSPTSNTELPGNIDMTLAIIAGAVGAAVVILVGGYILMRQK